MAGVARVVLHPLAPWMISVPLLSLCRGISHPCWVSGTTKEGRWGVINWLSILFLHVWVNDVGEDGDIAEV